MTQRSDQRPKWSRQSIMTSYDVFEGSPSDGGLGRLLRCAALSNLARGASVGVSWCAAVTSVSSAWLRAAT
eukprot:scaffold24676_cov61-Phaeocystis_antarctica.AAC.5